MLQDIVEMNSGEILTCDDIVPDGNNDIDFHNDKLKEHNDIISDVNNDVHNLSSVSIVGHITWICLTIT